MSENTPASDQCLSYRCPVCAAEPAEACRTRGDREVKYPHIRRLRLVDGWHQQRALRRAMPVRALCCECGNLRTVSSNWSFRRDDNKTCDDDDRRHPGRFWRMTGTLKCATCKRSTRHALLRDNDIPEHRDGAERHAQPRVQYVVRSDRAEAPAHGYSIVEGRTLQPGDLLHGRPVDEVVRRLAVVNASGDQIASAFGYEVGWHVETSCAVSKAVGMDNVFSLAHGLWVHFEDQAVNWLEMFGRLCANGSGS